MSQTKKPNEALKTYWRSISRRKTRLNVLGSRPEHAEFPPGADELVVEGGASRRKFMGILGASTALAGLTSTGCIRKPEQYIMAYAKRPEDLIPGVPVYYATACQVGGTVMGLLVESQDGRPTKIEGNPQHSGSQGATDAFAQASVLNLYDPERSKQPRSMTVSGHVFMPPGQGEQAKEELGHGLCERLHHLAIEETKSIDAAEAAKAKCAGIIETNGRWNSYLDGAGKEVTELSIDWDVQVPTTWGDARSAFLTAFEPIHKAGGEGMALVVRGSMSPTYRATQQAFVKAYPKAKVVLCDPSYPINMITASELVAGEGAQAYYSLEDASVILAADSDFLGTGPDHVRLTREYAAKRKLAKPEDTSGMNRLYCVEPHLTSTGAQADERLRLPGGDVVDFLAGLIIKLVEDHGVTLPPGAQQLGSQIATRGEFDEHTERYLTALAEDLASRLERPDAPGRARPERVAIIVGERQPPLAHGLGFLLNAMLQSASAQPPGALRFGSRFDQVPYATLAELAAGLEGGKIQTVICLDTNPAYEGPGNLGMAGKLGMAKLLIHAGTYLDETGQIAHWHLPLSHYLESWGDLEASDGTISLQQPLIAPLHDTRSSLEILSLLIPEEDAASGEWALSSADKSGDEIVRAYWDGEIKTSARPGGKGGELSDKVWRHWLHDGIVSGVPRGPSLKRPTKWRAFADAMGQRKVPDTSLYEVNFHLDPKVLAGDYSNNSWMQELPHPISKLVWDNGAYISAVLARELGVENGDNLTIKVGDASLDVPVWIAPGQHDRTVSLTLGYGRKGIGTVADGAGFDVNPLRPGETQWFVRAEVSRGSGNYDLVSTQDYGLLDPDGEAGTPIINFERRPIYRETDVAGYKKDPEFSKLGDLMPKERLKEPWARYNDEAKKDPSKHSPSKVYQLGVPVLHGPHQWAMSIDLNSCTACNACVIACQAENNIPVVGKDEVGNGREMHWMRIDRYYTGPEDNPDAVVMPVGCQHCETAPCENVCPVAATAHSPEGLNDMAYNRCIGTRYCANNCPYKVRRFNFLHYNRKEHPNDDYAGWDMPELLQMQKNPDVSIRFRGVIEKCSYCVQRINEAKIEAHVAGNDKVADGAIVTACEQVCPTQAIVFGDIVDPTSRVSKLKYATSEEDYRERTQTNRDYALLQDLLTKPRTTFLARVRNPNPKLA